MKRLQQEESNANFARSAGNAYEENAAPMGDKVKAGTVTTLNTGGGLSQNNMQPYLALPYCVAIVGTFPSRN